MQYTLILKNEKLKNYNSISLLLLIFNLLGFIFLLLKSEEGLNANSLLIISIFITTGYILFAIYNKRLKKDSPAQWHRILFLFCSLVWIVEKYWWFSIVLALFVLLDQLAHRKPEVRISKNSIFLPSIIKKEVSWKELNNVILKDDLLTIDFKNNKLFQHLIINSPIEIDEKRFNTFCHKCINNN